MIFRFADSGGVFFVNQAATFQVKPDKISDEIIQQ